jgi:hypothetical protein
MRKGLADPRGWIRFTAGFGTNSPTCLHAHLPHAAWLVDGRAWPRRSAGHRHAAQLLHGQERGGIRLRVQPLAADHVTAVSEARPRRIWPRDGERNSNLSVIWQTELTWIAGSRMHGHDRRRGGSWDRDDFLWLAVGRLEAVKDYPTLLKAIGARPPENGAAAGSGRGPAGKRAEEHGRGAGPRQRVRFAGFEPNVRAGCRPPMGLFFRRATKACRWCCWRPALAGCPRWPPMFPERAR